MHIVAEGYYNLFCLVNDKAKPLSMTHTAEVEDEIQFLRTVSSKRVSE